MAPIPAISHFVRLGFSPEKREKVLNISTRFLMDSASFRKKRRIVCICSIKEAVFKYLSFISRCFIIKRKKISNTSMKSYAEAGSPSQASLSSLKH